MLHASNRPSQDNQETDRKLSSGKPKFDTGACCTVINNCLYTFGGLQHNADVHELNLTSMVWTHLKAQNSRDGPFLKDKAGMVAYGSHMVCVLGGYGRPGREHIVDGIRRGQKGAQYAWDSNEICCWTNELHLFHTEQCKTLLLSLHSYFCLPPLFTFPLSPSLLSFFIPGVWISPEMTGTRPPPCAAFTLTKVDPHRVVMFGGRQFSERVNQLHILNMENWVCVYNCISFFFLVGYHSIEVPYKAEGYSVTGHQGPFN